MKTKLVYYMWVPDMMSPKENFIYQLHLRCLKHYSHIFNSATFVISLDNTSNYGLLKNIEKDIVNIGFNGNLNFKIIQNDKLLRETNTFYNEVVLKLNEPETLTFFAHNKGMTNITTGDWNHKSVDKLSLYHWITLMYYLNLEYIDEVTESMARDGQLAFGTIMLKDNRVASLNKWQYAGSFQWIYNRKLYEYMQRNNIETPLPNHRLYAENFLPNIMPMDFSLVASHDWRWYNGFFDPYRETYNNIEWLFKNNDELQQYINFFKNITSNEKQNISVNN